MSEQGSARGPSRVPLGAFFDPATDAKMRFELCRVETEEWKVLKQFGYRDHQGRVFICPANTETYRSDLASTPWFFKWLVPALGDHLPAILLHDALVVDGAASGDCPHFAESLCVHPQGVSCSVGDKQPCKTHLGPDVTREQADRIMREAMYSLGVGTARRWLAWTGASVGTAWSVFTPRLLSKIVTAGTFLIVAVLGVIATLDLFDVVDWLPWMGNRSTSKELAFGAAGAIVIPSVLSLLWYRPGTERWKIPLIGGIGLALLLHLTAALVAMYFLYQIGEFVLGPWTRPADQVESDNEVLIGNDASP